ncbi:hypothetical protein D3C81_1937000 [compost metagenome]
MNRAALINIALSTKALGKSAGSSTKLPISAWRNGVSRALSSPSRSAIPAMDAPSIQPNWVMTARVSDCKTSTTCTPISNRRLS